MSLTSTLYKMARLSNNMRAISKGPKAMAKRYVRRKIYGKTMGATDKLSKALRLK